MNEVYLAEVAAAATATKMRAAKRKAIGGGGLKKKKKSDDGVLTAKSKSKSKAERPYKVLYPGQRRFSSNPRHALRDPRLVPRQKNPDDDLVEVLNKWAKWAKSKGFYKHVSTSSYEYEDEDEDDDSTDGVEYEGPDITDSDSDDDTTDSDSDTSARRMKKKKKQEPLTVEAKLQLLHKQDCECAETAMKFYNHKHGTDYEIVETLGSYRKVYAGSWFHCNFRAAARCGAQPKLFFAELRPHNIHKPGFRYVVNRCTILHPPPPPPAPPHSNSFLVAPSHMIRGCKMCGDQLWHPINGFKVGK